MYINVFYTCMYVYTYIHRDVWIYTHLCVHVYTYIYIYIHVYTCVCIYLYIYIYIHRRLLSFVASGIPADINVRVWVCMISYIDFLYIHKYIRKYIRIYTNIYINIYVYIQICVCIFVHTYTHTCIGNAASWIVSHFWRASNVTLICVCISTHIYINIHNYI